MTSSATAPSFELLRQIPLYVPGKPIQEVKRELGVDDIVKLASNENPWGPTPQVKERLIQAIQGGKDEGVGLYPVSDGFYLRQAIAKRKGVETGQVILGNGSAEIDPFATPTDSDQTNHGDLIDDIGVKGRVVSGGKAFLVISDSRGNTRKVPVGYKFRDGEIVSIDDKQVVFHQWEVNSTNRSAYRTVVKAFKREEGKR